MAGAAADELIAILGGNHERDRGIWALDPLKSALAAVGADNITVGLTCRLGSLMDFVTKALNEITGTNEVHIEGERIGLDTEKNQ